MITRDFKELCLSPHVEEPKSEVNKPFVPEQQSRLCICIASVFAFVYVWYTH